MIVLHDQLLCWLCKGAEAAFSLGDDAWILPCEGSAF